MISIDVLEGQKPLTAIAPEWDALVPESFTAAFARSPWLLAWIETFVPQRIVTVTARAQGRLVGILPLARYRTDARGLYFRQVTPAARGDYVTPVVVPALVPHAVTEAPLA